MSYKLYAIYRDWQHVANIPATNGKIALQRHLRSIGECAQVHKCSDIWETEDKRTMACQVYADSEAHSPEEVLRSYRYHVPEQLRKW